MIKIGQGYDSHRFKNGEYVIIGGVKIKSKKSDHFLRELSQHYANTEVPLMPVSADLLMKKYEIPEGKQLGEKLKKIEEEWIKNNFKITDEQVNNIINN